MLPCFIPAKVGIPLTSPTVPPKIKQKKYSPATSGYFVFNLPCRLHGTILRTFRRGQRLDSPGRNRPWGRPSLRRCKPCPRPLAATGQLEEKHYWNKSKDYLEINVPSFALVPRSRFERAASAKDIGGTFSERSAIFPQAPTTPGKKMLEPWLLARRCTAMWGLNKRRRYNFQTSSISQNVISKENYQVAKVVSNTDFSEKLRVSSPSYKISLKTLFEKQLLWRNISIITLSNARTSDSTSLTLEHLAMVGLSWKVAHNRKVVLHPILISTMVNR